MPVFDPGVPWLRGTATLTNGSTTVTTDGVITLNEILEGDRLYVMDGGERIGPFEIVGGEGSVVELREAFEGSTGSYAIAIDRNPVTRAGAKILRDVSKILATVEETDFLVDGLDDAVQTAEQARDEAVTAKDAAQNLYGDLEAVQQAAGAAEEAADRAEISRAASRSIFEDAAAGLAATTDGDYFSVPSPDDDGNLILYHNDAGSATEISRYPSAHGVRAEVYGVGRDLGAELASDKAFFDSSPFGFAVIDEDGRVLISDNISGDEPPTVISAFYSRGESELPFAFVDEAGGVLFGERRDGTFYAPGLDLTVALLLEDPKVPDLSFAVVDEAGQVLFGTRQDGTFYAPGLDPGAHERASEPDAMVDVADGHVYLTTEAGRERVLDGTDYPVLAAAPLPGRRYIATQARPLLGTHRTIIGDPDGLAMPAGEPLLVHILLYGQSLSVGQNGFPLLATENAYPDHVLMFDGEGVDVRMGLPTTSTMLEVLDTETLTGFQPLVAMTGPDGNKGQTIAESLGARLQARCQSRAETPLRLLFSAPGLAGTGYSGLKQGTTPYANLLASVERAKELAEARGWRYVVPALCLMHGESNAANSEYASYLIEWQADLSADIQAITGQAADLHFYMGQPSTFRASTNGRACLAMLDVHKSSPHHTLIGPQYGCIYSSDNLHMSALGYQQMGERFAAALERQLLGVKRWEPVRPLSIARAGDTIDIEFASVSGALAFDISTVSNPGHYGFEYVDDSDSASIHAVALLNDTTVRITLSNTPTGANPRLRYAMRGYPDGTRDEADQPRGNLRDAKPIVAENFHWCVHFDEPID